MTFYRVTEGGEAVINGSFVREAILPNRDAGMQLSLWRETVVLDEVFYESLIRHPLPLRESAIRALAGRSMAIDLYVWLAIGYTIWTGPRGCRGPRYTVSSGAALPYSANSGLMLGMLSP